MAKNNFSMSVETDAFNRHIRDFMRRTDISQEKVLKKFAFDLLKRIMQKNPVNTGRSRAAWYISMEKLDQGTVSLKKGSNYDPAEETKGRTEGRFIDNTKHTLNKWLEMINGVDYIIYLEYGSSNQAPYGMVRLSMRELRKGRLPKDMTDQIKKDWNKFY